MLQEIDKSYNFEDDRRLLVRSFSSFVTPEEANRFFTTYMKAILHGYKDAHYYRAISSTTPQPEASPSLAIMVTGPRPQAPVEKENRAYVYCLAVDPDHQGKGYGRALINSLWSLFPKIRKVYLHTHRINAAGLGFYRKLGFTETARSRRQPDVKRIELRLHRPGYLPFFFRVTSQFIKYARRAWQQAV